MPQRNGGRLSALRPLPIVQVQPSSIHGLGAFATKDIGAGQKVATYAGKRYGRHVARPEWDGAMTFLFLLSDGTLIDGAEGGNATRHINHACRPNVEAVEVRDRSNRLSVQVRATQRICAGAELLLDYALDVPDSDPSEFPCKCGDEECRGSLAAPVQ